MLEEQESSLGCTAKSYLINRQAKKPTTIKVRPCGKWVKAGYSSQNDCFPTLPLKNGFPSHARKNMGHASLNGLTIGTSTYPPA